MKTLFPASMLALAAPALAAGFVDHAALDRAAEQFAGAAIGAEGGPAAPVDRRLRLAHCPSDPALSWRSDRHDAIVIRCTETGWRIFVPVRAAAAAPAAAQAIRTIAARPEPVIRRGDTVNLSAESATFTVSSYGVAMGNAAPGDRLSVRIEGVKAPVQAIAIEAGRASLPGW